MKTATITLFLALSILCSAQEKKSLSGSDSLTIFTKDLPKERYSYTTTFCGLSVTKDFKEGYYVAQRLLRSGAKAHYLSYPEFKPTLSDQPKLNSVLLTDYKLSKKLSESVNGYNYAMAMNVFDRKLRELRDKEAKAKKQAEQGASSDR